MHEDSTHSLATRYSVGLSAVYDDGVWTSSSRSPACLCFFFLFVLNPAIADFVYYHSIPPFEIRLILKQYLPHSHYTRRRALHAHRKVHIMIGR